MRIEYYDADTHDLIRRDAYSQALVDALRERDEARAEVERLRAAAPTVQTVDAEAVVRRIEARYIGAARGDARDREYDALRVIVQEATRPVSVERVAEASYQEHRKRHVDLPSWETNAEVNREEWRYAARAALRAIGARLAEQRRKDVDRWEATSQAQAIEEHKLRAEAERLRAAPPIVTTATHVQIPRADYERVAHLLDGDAAPPVYLTDIEAAVKEWGDWTDSLTATLKNHTRPIDREGLAQVIYDASYGRPGVDLTYANKNEVRVVLAYAVTDAVLRHLGAQAAQPVDYNALAQAIDEGLVKSANDERPDCDRAADAALAFLGLRAVGRPQTEEEVEAMEAAQPVEPKPEPAQLPVCARCGRFACACGCEPAKVRVKPPKGYIIETRGTGRDADRIAEQVDAVWIKSLREQGVEVEE